MVVPGRAPLEGLVEVDETTIPYRGKDDPVAAGPGRTHAGKLLVAGAVEIQGRGPGRARLQVIEDDAAATLEAFVASSVAKGATVVSDGWAGYRKLEHVQHHPKVVGKMAAHVVLPWVHRVFSNAKRWTLGVYHGVRKKHLQAYLDEYVFRFNRRSGRPTAFRTLLATALALTPATYNMLITPDARG